MAKFYNAQLIVTLNCNARCKMCNIWQNKDNQELVTPEEYARIPSNAEVIDITGGEPFLRKDIVKIIDKVHNKAPKARIVFCSNGFATQHIINKVKEIKKITENIEIGISIDGIGEIHDEIRGIKGGFDKAMDTVAELKEIGVSKIKLLYTASDYNVSEMMKVYNHSKQLGIEFSLAIVHNSDQYYSTQLNDITKIDELKNQLNQLIKEELRGWNIKKWFRAFFAYGAFIFTTTKKRLIPCKAGLTYFTVQPNGDITPSHVSSTILGNIKEVEDVETTITQRDTKEKARSEKETKESWMVCTVRPEMHEHLFQIGIWIIKNKFFNFSGRYLN